MAAINNDPKMVIAMKFINNILTNSNKPEVNVITDFKDVKREEIVTQQNLDILNNMEEEIYKHFDKIKCGFYRKSDSYVLNCFRGMVKQLGHKPVHKEKDKTVNVEGVNYRKKFVYYHIE
jgi:hypothetical protein